MVAFPPDVLPPEEDPLQAVRPSPRPNPSARHPDPMIRRCMPTPDPYICRSELSSAGLSADHCGRPVQCPRLLERTTISFNMSIISFNMSIGCLSLIHISEPTRQAEI